MKLTRRKFLIATGLIVGGVTVVINKGKILPLLPYSDLPSMDEGITWIQILPSGTVRFLCPRAEMGQGISVGLTQVVAAELNVNPAQIECVHPSTDDLAPVRLTVGSESMSDFFMPTAYGAAVLREKLRKRAASKYGVDSENIKTSTEVDGAFVTDSGIHITYAELAAKETIIEADEISDIGIERLELAKHHLKSNRHLQWNHAELADIVQGRMRYSRDIEVPEMLYGKVIKPSRFGASLDKVDLTAAQSNSSVVKLFADKSNNRIGVICDSPFTLATIVDDIKAEWKSSEDYQQEDLDRVMDVDQYRRKDDFEHTLVESGSLESAATQNNARVVARYKTSMAAHAAIEPRSAVAHYTPEKTEVWGASQSIHFVRDRVARITGQSAEQVVVYGHRLGGAFGGRVICQAAEEAAYLSKAVGKPVRVQWSRQEEFRHNHVQPQFDHHIEAAVAADGKLIAWEQYFTTSPIIFSSAVLPKHIQYLADRSQEDGSPRGATPPYDIPNIVIRYSDIRTPLTTSAWRGLGAAPNTYARECMLDELAAEIEMDPVAIRLKNLSTDQERLAEVIKAAAELSGWGRDAEANYGLGIAGALYKKTAVAVVAEVYVDPSTQDIKVTRVWCAQDCGMVVNPDRVQALVQGNIVWGISMALKERATISDGLYTAANFDKYQVARMHDIPDVKVKMIEREGQPPLGVGEPAIAPTPAAVANAVYAATGTRLRHLPLSFE